MLTVTIKPVEPESKPPKTLADVEPFVLCVVCPSCVERAWKDGFGNVWRLGSNGVPHCLDWKPYDYPVLKVIGSLVFPTEGTEVKVKPAKPQTLDKLKPWEFAMVRYANLQWSYPHCHYDEKVFIVEGAHIPVSTVGKPSEYTVIGESLGQLQIKFEEEEPDDE